MENTKQKKERVLIFKASCLFLEKLTCRWRNETNVKTKAQDKVSVMAVWPALRKMLARHEIVIGPQNQLSNRICPNWNHWLWDSFNSFSHHPTWPVSSKISKQTVFFHILRICSINLGPISRSHLCELHTHIIHVAGFVFREKLGEVIPGDQKKTDGEIQGSRTEIFSCSACLKSEIHFPLFDFKHKIHV